MFLFILCLKTIGKCNACKAKISAKRDKLQKYVSKGTFEHANLSICESFSGSKLSYCEKFVNTFNEQLKNNFATLSDEEICSSFGACPARPIPLAVPSTEGAALMAGEKDSCTFCREEFDYVTGPGLQAHGVPMALELVKDVCPGMPLVKDVCNSFSSHHAARMILLITSKFQSYELCQAAGLCPQK